MAGDWIKMRSNLWDDPRVARLCDLTDSTEAAVVGALYWLWATADQHTENGVMPGLTLRQIDRKTGVLGIGEALCAIGWLADHPEGVRIVNFEEHNGSSAKKRCQTAKRVATHRVSDEPVTQSALPNADKSVSTALAREEKRREEKSNTSTEADASVSAAAKTPRPSRKAPASFALTDELRGWAAEHAPGIDAEAETAKFLDHTFGAARADWLGTWRNWIRKAQERHPGLARASPSASQEPAWVIEKRERMAQFAGRSAAKPSRHANVIDMGEICDAKQLG